MEYSKFGKIYAFTTYYTGNYLNIGHRYPATGGCYRILQEFKSRYVPAIRFPSALRYVSFHLVQANNLLPGIKSNCMLN